MFKYWYMKLLLLLSVESTCILSFSPHIAADFDGFIVEDENSITSNHSNKQVARSEIINFQVAKASNKSTKTLYKPVTKSMALGFAPAKHNPLFNHPNLRRHNLNSGNMALSLTQLSHKSSTDSRGNTQYLRHIEPKINLEKTLTALASSQDKSFHEKNIILQYGLHNRRNMLTNSTIKGFLSKDVNFTIKDVGASPTSRDRQTVNMVHRVTVPKHESNSTTNYFANLLRKLHVKKQNKLSPQRVEKLNISNSINQTVSQNVFNNNSGVKVANIANQTKISLANNATTKLLANATGTIKPTDHPLQPAKFYNVTYTSGEQVSSSSHHPHHQKLHFIDAQAFGVLQHYNHERDGLKKDVIDGHFQIECGENKTCAQDKYCYHHFCYSCHHKHHECVSDEQCCNSMPCVYGRCDDKPKGNPGTICKSDGDCNDGCCVIEPTIDEEHGICKQKLREFHQCSPVLFRKVWIGDEKPECGPCEDGLQCVEKGVSASHLVCMKKKS